MLDYIEELLEEPEFWDQDEFGAWNQDDFEVEDYLDELAEV